jgi:hypothetical protein
MAVPISLPLSRHSMVPARREILGIPNAHQGLHDDFHSSVGYLGVDGTGNARTSFLSGAWNATVICL